MSGTQDEEPNRTWSLTVEFTLLFVPATPIPCAFSDKRVRRVTETALNITWGQSLKHA